MNQSRDFDAKLLDILQKNRIIKQENGLIVIEKPVPDDPRAGTMDARAYSILNEKAQSINEITGNETARELVKKNASMYLDYSKRIGKIFTGNLDPIVEPIKAMFDQVTARKISGPMIVSEQKIFSMESAPHAVPVRCYRPKELESTPNLPIVIYIHGGGFVGGNLDTVDELCRMLSEKASCEVVSVDYRLSPTHKFPAALQDCLTVLHWVDHHADSLLIDRRRIAIAGDSAGGNLAAACVLKDRQRPADQRRIKAQILYYPLLNLAVLPDSSYSQGKRTFWVRKPYAALLKQSLALMRLLITLVPIVIGTGKVKSPYISPYYAKDLPTIPTLLIVPEYDVLRPEGEAYAVKLLKNGSPVRLIRYKGINHGFVEMVGRVPQAEDAISETASFLKSVFDRPFLDAKP